MYVYTNQIHRQQAKQAKQRKQYWPNKQEQKANKADIDK